MIDERKIIPYLETMQKYFDTQTIERPDKMKEFTHLSSYNNSLIRLIKDGNFKAITSKVPSFLDQALNEGDGVYRP